MAHNKWEEQINYFGRDSRRPADGLGEQRMAT